MKRLLAVLILLPLAAPPPTDSACCYFSAKDKDISQPSQKVFITWDPAEQVESFTVQPKFEGNAVDFGMVIPTPSKPKLDEMPRDFFKELAVYTILKKREQVASKLLPASFSGGGGFGGGGFAGGGGGGLPAFSGGTTDPKRPPPVIVLETGIVGSLDYKIITAQRADDLFTWLKDNKYSYAGDEATLDHYVKKQWIFTVMKIDTMQMKKRPDGSYSGDVTPTRFTFASDQLIYPLKITQISVKDKTEALFYIQAPHKVDLPGDMTYQYQWTPMLKNAEGWYAKGSFGPNPGNLPELPGKGGQWLKACAPAWPKAQERAQQLGFLFNGGRPTANQEGRIPTTLEWAKKLTAEDIGVLTGKSAYTDRKPDVDAGFTRADVYDAKRGPVVTQIINERLAKARKERPHGYLLREAPADDVKQLRLLAGHLKEGQFITKLRKTFTKAEMNEDLLIVPAKLGDAVDVSEYEEMLPTSPP